MTPPALDALCLRCRKKPDNVLFTRDLLNTGVSVTVFCHGNMAHENIHDRHLLPFTHGTVTITLRPFAR